MIDRRTLIAALAAEPIAKPAPSKVASLSDIFDAAFQEQALYLPRLSRHEAVLAADPTAAIGQVFAQELAMVGDEAGVQREMTVAYVRPLGPPVDLDGVVARDALDEIVHASKGRRVVVLNDNHSLSSTRAFAHAVALRLQQEGFRLFAAETFANNPVVADFQSFADHGEPVTPAVGFYTSDPVFAEMIRDLRSRGWRFAAYEQRPDQVTLAHGGALLTGEPAREQAQAQNIAAILETHPNERLLVYCGHGHGTKRRTSGEPLMGGRLAAQGVLMSTIDQVQGSPKLPGGTDLTWLAQALARWRPVRSLALIRAPGHAFAPPGWVDGAYDVFILHPRLAPVDGRPGWLAAAPGRKPVQVSLPGGLPARALVQAVPTAEAAQVVNVIPSDQYLLPVADVRAAHFLLRPGRYQVRVETSAGRTLLPTAVTVN